MKKEFYLFFGLLLAGCNETISSSPQSVDSQDWLINLEYVRQGCFAGRDCIPSLEEPTKTTVDGPYLDFLDDSDLVIGVWNGSDYVAYPHPVMDWHEIANEPDYSISYCPLTGSAIHFSADGEFGVSGLLYNSNLIMYDRKTESYWPQMFLKSASGEQKGTELELKPLLETTWGTWKKLFPDSKVVNSQTGFNRRYTRYPYGDYKTCNGQNCRDFIYFPVATLDERLPAKTRVLAIIADDEQRAYPISYFQTITLLQEVIGGQKFTIVISGQDNLAIAFATDRNLFLVSSKLNSTSFMLQDSVGNRWDILGHSPATTLGDLPAANAFIAYWFAQAAFYPNTVIYQ
ncbi:MAG: DUF3179 domain-containing protein [Fidelibacterota bacterium]